MKKSLFMLLFCLVSLSTFAQIISDSTVDVVAYWVKADKMNYSVQNYKAKIVGEDTISIDLITYDVEITVLNATKNSYTIQWAHKNIETDNPKPNIQKLLLITNNLKVQFKTNEFGSFMEVVNWKEIRRHIQKKIAALRKEFKDTPEMGLVLNNVEKIYMTKEAIEAVAIKDIRQFLTFHGSGYKLGEQFITSGEVFNLYQTRPFDTNFIYDLEEINHEDGNFVLTEHYAVSEEQLQDAAYNLSLNLAIQLKETAPKKEDLINFRNESILRAAIHESGWPLWSFQKNTNSALNSTHIEEFIIELK